MPAQLLSVRLLHAQETLEPQVDMIEWPSFHNALEGAVQSGKIILIDVYADTCPWCRKLQSEIYTQEELQTYVLDTFELGRINIGIADDTLSYKGIYALLSPTGFGFWSNGYPDDVIPGARWLVHNPVARISRAR